MADTKISRRSFLSATALGAGSLILAACAPAPAAPTQAPAEAEAPEATAVPQEEAPAEAPAEGKTVRFGSYIFQNFEGALRTILAGWEEQNPGVKLETEFSGDDYWTKMQTEIAAGTPVDVSIASCIFPVSYAKKKAVLELDEYVNRDQFDLTQFPASTVDQYRVAEGAFDSGGDGKLYGLPGDAQGYLFVYNKDMFDAAGVAYPTDDWTWDDVVTAAKAITKPEEDKWGCYAPHFATLTGEGEFLYSGGGKLITEDWKKSGLDLPESIGVFQWVWDLIYTHTVAPQPVPSEATNPFASGRVAMMWDGVWWLADFAQITDFEWDIAMHPKHPQTGKRTMSAQSDGWWMFKDAKEKELGWDLLKYLVGESTQRALMEANYFIPPSLPGPAEEFYAKKPPEHRSKALEGLLADNRKYAATYYESATVSGAFMPELEKAFYDGADVVEQVKAAAAVMNDELAKAWASFEA